MFDRISNTEIENALDILIGYYGVREDISCNRFIKLLNKNYKADCAQEIASLLGLPINITLRFVSDSFNPNSTDKFHSTSITKFNRVTNSGSGIVAQVLLPDQLPMYGSYGLQGYPIEIRISPKCFSNSYTAVTILSHELSHVLLASVSPKYRHNELYTDCVPLILGFRDIVRSGRKIIKSTKFGRTTSTQTTSFGYLTDAQFEFAYDYVGRHLSHHNTQKQKLLKLAKAVINKCNMATKYLSTFNEIFHYLNQHPPQNMKPQHANRMVILHQNDFTRGWNQQIEHLRNLANSIQAQMQTIKHYLEHITKKMINDIAILEEAKLEINNLIKEIAKDNKIMLQYVDYLTRIRRFLKNFHNTINQ